MAIPIGRGESYDSLRPYLPEDAKAILEKEIPRIRKQIDGEIEDFAKSFGETIKMEIGNLSKEIEGESKAARERLGRILEEFAKGSSSAAELKDAANKLEAEIKTYQQKWEDMGKTTRKAVLTAAKAVGVPVPLDLG